MLMSKGVNMKPFDARHIAKFLMQELEVPLTAENIQQAQKEPIWNIYRVFLKKEFNVGEESLLCLPMQAQFQNEINDMELYRQATPCLLLHKTLSSVYNDFFGIDFTMTDLINPEPERTRELLSLLVHLIDILRKVDGPSKQVRDDVLAEAKEYSDLQKEVEILEEKLVNGRKEEDARKRRENQLGETKLRMIGELKTVKNEAEALREEIVGLTDEMEKKKAKKKELEVRIQSSAQRERDLLETIIDDPAQILEEKTDFENQRNQLKDSLHKSHTELAEIRAEYEIQTKIRSTLLSNKDEITSLKESRKVLDQVNLEVVALQRELERIVLGVEAAQQDLAANEAARTSAIQEHEKASIEYQQLTDELQRSIAQLKKEVSEIETSESSDTREIRAEIRERQLELLSLQKEIERQQQEFKQSWKDSVKEVEEIARLVNENTRRSVKLWSLCKNTTLEVHEKLHEDGVHCANGSFVQLASPVRAVAETSSSLLKKLNRSTPRLSFKDSSYTGLQSFSREPPQSAKRNKQGETFDADHSFTGPLGRF